MQAFRFLSLISTTCILTGCILIDVEKGKSSFGAPIACLEQVVKSRYNSWERENPNEIKNLKEISLKKDWHLLVACNRAVKEIDLHNSVCENVYISKNRIIYAGIQDKGRIALIESKSALSPVERKNSVVLLNGGAVILKIDIKAGNLLGNYLGGTPVLAKDKFILYPAGNLVMLYEIDNGKQRVIYEGRHNSSLLTIKHTGNRYFIVMTDNKRNPAKSEMAILDSRFQVELRIPQVTNIMLYGKRFLIEQNGAIFEFNPITNTTRAIINGTLLAVINESSFLFTDSIWKTKEDGWLRLEYALYEYNLTKGNSRKIAGKFSIDTCYGVTYPIISPDKEYVIVADNTNSALLDSEYFVYRIATGEKVCSFYEPFIGEYYFTYLLAWLDNSKETCFDQIKASGAE